MLCISDDGLAPYNSHHELSLCVRGEIKGVGVGGRGQIKVITGRGQIKAIALPTLLHYEQPCKESATYQPD